MGLMTKFLSVIILLHIAKLSLSQTFDATRIQVSWEVLKTDYKDKPAIRAALTLTNQSKSPMPSSGWKIYLNYGRQVSDVTGNVTWDYINGDLNSIIPTNSFQTLLPGQSHRIEYTASGRAINFTDAPSGFYLVWDNQPSKGVSLKKTIVKPLQKENEDGHVSPEKIYHKNESIKDISQENLIKIFPRPAFYKKMPGVFKLHAKVAIKADQTFINEALLLAQDLKDIFDRRVVINPSNNNSALVNLRLVEGMNKEAYTLKIESTGITINASSPTGVFYGIQSMKSMFPPELSRKQQVITLPAVEVIDSPRFAYRAFMMDVARNFQPKEQVLKVLDLMAFYKLNVLHFHLNDDEGWRLEIPSLPELTEVGSKRAHSLDSRSTLPASYGSGPSVDNPFGTGYYSRADFIHILKYAAERHIRVIPEVETPGHARAAVKSMYARYEKYLKAGNKEEAERYLLSDVNDKSVYQSVQKWNDNIMNVAMPSTYAFIEKVVDEIISMYKDAGAPLTTIHLGGDEVPAGSWERSPAVQALQQSNPQIKSVDDLWYYYFRKVNNMLKSKNLYLSGWEEVALRKTQLDGKPRYIPNPDFVNENFHAYVWNNVWG
ncbi:beta-N-acetylhexosaminidase, partial [Pseudoxanthomonas sp. SGD-10]